MALGHGAARPATLFEPSMIQNRLYLIHDFVTPRLPSCWATSKQDSSAYKGKASWLGTCNVSIPAYLLEL